MAQNEPECDIYLDNETATLHIAKETSDLAAFQWKVPADSSVNKTKLIMYLVFEDNQTHLLSLEPDKGEKPFRRVQSKTQKKSVQLLSDEDIQLYLKDSEMTESEIESLLNGVLEQ